MVRLATLLVGDQDRAEDVVQDAFVRVHRRWNRIDNHGGYLRTAVVNACRSHHRRQAMIRRREPTLRSTAETEADHGQTAAAEAPFEAAAADDELVHAVARLPYRRRAAIVLRYYADLADDDVAEALGVRPPTVRTLIHRGIAQLRKELPR